MAWPHRRRRLVHSCKSLIRGRPFRQRLCSKANQPGPRVRGPIKSLPSRASRRRGTAARGGNGAAAQFFQKLFLGVGGKKSGQGRDDAPTAPDSGGRRASGAVAGGAARGRVNAPPPLAARDFSRGARAQSWPRRSRDRPPGPSDWRGKILLRHFGVGFVGPGGQPFFEPRPAAGGPKSGPVRRCRPWGRSYGRPGSRGRRRGLQRLRREGDRKY